MNTPRREFIRKGPWKAVQRSENNKGEVMLPIELYSLDNDLGEAHNLAVAHPELVQGLERLMDQAHVPIK